ncbi:MAG: glycerophosphodiester phosphodiesterase family protein, partial [Oscillospiraceae bacterium]|nr:glycerophosphodiester phosphodiesterase family protein [Oscillospiraceae bacterium]
MIVLFPLTGVISLSNAAFKVKIPLFIELGIEARPLFAVLFQVFYIFLILAEIGVFFSINIYVLQKKSFFQSCKDAWRLGKWRWLNTVICMLLISLTVVFAVKLIAAVLPIANTAKAVVTYIISAIIVPPVNNAGATALFYQYYEEDESLAGITPHIFKTEKFSKVKKTAMAGCFILAFAGSIFYAAHHYAYLAEAFELAIAEGLPWIELDVQITADGVVVAEHDQTLIRRFGLGCAVQDMTYDELMQYEVINSKGDEYKHVRVTTLEDVLLL